MVEAFVDANKVAVNREITGTPSQLQNELKIWKDVVDSTEKNILCETVFTEGDLADANRYRVFYADWSLLSEQHV